MMIYGKGELTNIYDVEALLYVQEAQLEVQFWMLLRVWSTQTQEELVIILDLITYFVEELDQHVVEVVRERCILQVADQHVNSATSMATQW